MALYAYCHVIANERTCYWLFHRLRWTPVHAPDDSLLMSWTLHTLGISLAWASAGDVRSMVE